MWTYFQGGCNRNIKFWAASLYEATNIDQVNVTGNKRKTW